MAELTMPRLSDSMEEGTIARWLLADGAAVAEGDELVEIETDKATMAYESELTGTLHIVVPEGDSVAVGRVIAQVLAAGEAASAPAAAEPPAPVRAPAPSAALTPSGGAGAPVAPAPVAAGARAKASPVARRVARALGVDLVALAGSGPQGRVTKRDVEAAAGDAAAPASAAADAPPAAPEAPAGANGAGAAPPGAKGAPEVVELSRTQATIARRMAEAKSTQPEFTLSVEVAMEEAVALRGRLKALEDSVVPSYNDMVVRAAALALREHPRANAAFHPGRFELYPHVNVGVAVAVEDGLLVPTVVGADRLSLGAIARETRRLAAAARDGTLAPGDLSGGTFSVSNLGMLGVRAFTAVLNTPQAAILAVGALQQRPVVRDGALAVGHELTLTLTCDHRILYGADAARFLTAIRRGLEEPLRLAL